MLPKSCSPGRNTTSLVSPISSSILSDETKPGKATQWTFGVRAVSLQRCSKVVLSFQEKIVRRQELPYFVVEADRAPPDVNQFSIITELLGTPPEDVIQTICSENVGPLSRFRTFPG